MKRTNKIRKKLVLSRESLANLSGGTLIIMRDSGSLSCTGPDCGGGGGTVLSQDWPCSDICG